MTSFVTEATRSVITASSYRALSASAGVIAILLLVVLLAQKEVVRAIWPSRSRPASCRSTTICTSRPATPSPRTN